MQWVDELFVRWPSFLPKLAVPSGYERAMRCKRSPTGERWLLRNDIEGSAVLKGSWNTMIVSAAIMIVALAALTAAFGLMALVYGIVPGLLVPVIASSLYLAAPDGLGRAEERRMLGEAPSIIGCMTMSMQVRPSLEQAVIFASERGDGVLSVRLREALWSNLMRRSSLPEALDELTSSLSEANFSLKQSIHLVISATCERSKQGMDRLLDKANSVAMGGVKDAVDSYAASLSMPAMMLFSLGTLLPIMLFSILPLLSLGTSMGQGTGPAVPLPHLAFLLLFLIPLSSLFYAWTILIKNPLGLARGSVDEVMSLLTMDMAIVWAAMIVATAVLELGELRPYLISGAAVLVPCAFLGWRLRGHVPSRRLRRKLEKEAITALFQIGNRMVSGATFEKALEEAAEGMSGSPFQTFGRSLLYRARLYGRPLEEIILEEGSLGSASRMMENAYITVVQCAARDPRYAGQIALNLAHMLSEVGSCQVKIEEKLRGVVEMMRSTSVLFAPIVLGVTGALFTLIGSQASAAGSTADDIALMTGIYIGELSLLVSFFTVLVMGDRSWRGVLHSYATRTPVAFLVFVSVSLICRTGLSSLI